jgi:DNA-binding NarL/FixJ family response regulator
MTAELTAVICDDDPMTRQMVRAVVERAGYRVLAGVDNAMDALNLVLAHKPHVLVLDLVLPGVGGEDIIEAIQECSDTNVIVHSAYDPRFAVKRGARHFVSKGQLALLEQMLQRVKGVEAGVPSL